MSANPFDPFASSSPNSAAPSAKPATLFNPFAQEPGAVDSPSLSRRLLVKSGQPPSQRDVDDDDYDSSDESESSDFDDDLPETAGDPSDLIDKHSLPWEKILSRWHAAARSLVVALAAHRNIADFNFQRQALREGAFQAAVRILNDPKDDREALLASLGLLKRLSAKESPASLEERTFSVESLDRLVNESSSTTNPGKSDYRMRALAISILAAVQDKEQLERLGFFTLVLGFLTEEGSDSWPQVLENAIAIGITNFSLQVERQKRILDAVGMERLTRWAKSEEKDLKSCASAFVSNLVANEECKYQIIHDGGLTILLRFMNAPGTPLFKIHACRGLANLALHAEAHIPMLERGALVILTDVINQSGDVKDELVRNACRCMAYLTKSDAPCASEAAQFLASHSTALAKLQELSRFSPNDQIQTWSAKVSENVQLCAVKSSSKSKFLSKKKMPVARIAHLSERKPSIGDLGAWKLQSGTDATDREISAAKPTKVKKPAQDGFEELSQRKASIKKKKKKVTRHGLIDS